MTQRGDIILARFPYTDQTGAKLRPVLVLTLIPGVHIDFVVMFISSQQHQAVPDLDVTLGPASSAFGATGLKTPSVFRIGKIASLSDALIMGKLGELAEPVFDDVVGRLVRLLRPV